MQKTMWYGGLPHKEGIRDILHHLEMIRRRLVRLNKSLFIVMYVDKCCDWRKSINECWPEALVKLDIFHWLQRISDIYADPNSPEAHLCNILLTQAVFCIPEDEFERATEFLTQRLGKKPDFRAVMKEANRRPPTRQEQLLAFDLVIEWMVQADKAACGIQIDLTDTNARPLKRIFKNDDAKVKRRILLQRQHIVNGCLCGITPDMTNYNEYKDICSYFKNQSGRTFSTQGTQEPVNRIVNEALRYPVSIQRAARNMAFVIERFNSNKEYVQMGEKPFHVPVEACALANSLSSLMGLDKPYKISLPSSDHIEPMGFTLVGIDGVDDPRTSFVEILDDSPELIVGDGEVPQAIRNEIDATGLEEDPELLIAGSDPVAPTQGNDGLQTDLSEEELQQVEAEVKKLGTAFSRIISKGQTSLEAYDEMLNGFAHYPFALDPKESELAKAEHELFLQLEPKYDINQSDTKAADGYRSFAKEWNREVAKRAKEHVYRQEDVVLINHKSWNILADYYKKLNGQEESGSRMGQARTHLLAANTVIRAVGRANRGTLKIGQVQRTEYQAGGNVPVGMPNKNANLMGHAYAPEQPTGDSEAPYTLPKPTVLETTTPQLEMGDAQQTAIVPVTKKPDGRTLCPKCGLHRNQHMKGFFGWKNCNQELCGSCWKTLKQHETEAKKLKIVDMQKIMGRNCVFKKKH
jgi:hypothetical protein